MVHVCLHIFKERYSIKQIHMMTLNLKRNILIEEIQEIIQCGRNKETMSVENGEKRKRDLELLLAVSRNKTVKRDERDLRG